MLISVALLLVSGAFASVIQGGCLTCGLSTEAFSQIDCAASVSFLQSSMHMEAKSGNAGPYERMSATGGSSSSSLLQGSVELRAFQTQGSSGLLTDGAMTQPRIQQRQGNDEPLLFLAVYTGRGYSDQRVDVRRSWLKHSSLASGTAKSYFFVGEADPADPSADNVTSQLAKEMEMHKDIIELPVIDNYKNLNLKTSALLDWFSRERPARFLAKVDDDTFPHLNLLLPRLHDLTSENVYMGLLFKCAPVSRTGRWAEKSEYTGSMYPWYMQGPAYFLDLSLVEKIVAMQNRTFVTNEDAMVGLWISQLNLTGVPVEYVPLASSQEGCTPEDYLSQNLPLGAMPAMWERGSCCGPHPWNYYRSWHASTGILDRCQGS